MTLVFSKRASRDLNAVLDYILERNPRGAAEVLRRVKDVLALLEQHPHSGSMTDRVGVRRMPLNPHPYAIFYRVRREDVIILRIRHGARRPG